MTPSTSRPRPTLRTRALVAMAVATAMSTFGVGCSKNANDDNIQPSTPAGGQTGTNPGPTLSPNGATVPTT